jgi:nicotinamidase-related amidase
MSMRLQFPLTTDQLELLHAFAQAQGLMELSEMLHKDQSVVSRNLQKLAESAPVIEKVNRRWQITEMGREINHETIAFHKILSQKLSLTKLAPVFQIATTALVLVNTQKALEDGPHNAEVIANIAQLIARARMIGLTIIHVRHLSPNSQSPLYVNAPGAGFISTLAPLQGDLEFSKDKASILISKACNEALADFQSFILAGFTGSDCIEASARDLYSGGFETWVVGDASARLDLLGPDGKLHKAERVHRLAMANIHAYSAKVISTSQCLDMQR